MAKPFMPALLGVNAAIREQIAPGADLSDVDGSGWAWVDVTADMKHAAGTSTTIGRQDNVSVSPAARHSLALGNSSGDYTTLNPTGAYFPGFRRYMPIRQQMTLDGVTWVNRFQGYLDSAPPTSDTSGKVRLTSITALGALGRIAGRKKPLLPALTRAIPGVSPWAWWMLDDGSSATFAASGLAGALPIALQPGVELTTDGPPGAAGSMKFTGGGSVSVPLSGGSASIVRVGFAFQSDDALPSDWEALSWSDTTGARWSIWLLSATQVGEGITVTRYAPDGTGVAFSDTSAAMRISDNGWHYIEIVLKQTSTNIDLAVSMDGSTWASHLTALAATTLGVPNRLTLSPGTVPGASVNFSLAGVAFSTPASLAPSLIAPALGDAMSGYAGELAHERLARLLAENGYALDLTGTSDIAMGPQLPATLSSLIEECATADHGVLGDGLGPGCWYVCRTSLYNLDPALQLDMSNLEVTPPFAPQYDNQGFTNLWKVSGPGGAPITVEATGGDIGTDVVGVADGQATVNVDDLSTLYAHGGWLLANSTFPGYRYPALPIALRQLAAQASAKVATVLALLPADRIDILNVTSKAVGMPPDDVIQVLQGWTETTTADDWNITGNCTPYDANDVALVGTGRVDADGSLTVGTMTTTSTTLGVSFTPEWSPNLPYNLTVAGEEMRATARVRSGSTQSLTVVRSINGVVKTHAANEPVHVAAPARIAL